MMASHRWEAACSQRAAGTLQFQGKKPSILLTYGDAGVASVCEVLRAYGESLMRQNPREGGFETLGMGTPLMSRVFKEKAHRSSGCICARSTPARKG